MSSREHPDISYLKQDEIGKVLAKGLAELYVKQPQFPIDYLAKWLLNYSIAQENEKSMKSKVMHKQNLQHAYEEQLKVKQQETDQRKAEQSAYDKIDTDYEQKLKDHLYHDELLLSDFPNFLESRKNLTGCYIGILDYPSKEVTQDDDDENAHLDANANKLIKYIGYSDSHKEILEGKTLPLEQGVTGDVFQPKEPPADNQEEGGEPKPIVDDFVYIPNVIKNERMFYFKIPKLGAYMAIPLFYNSCLNENSFDKSLEQRLEFLKQKADQKTEFETKKAEFEKQIQEKEEANEDPTEIQEQWQAEQENFQEIVEPVFPSVQKQYVTCVDTLGQDREISTDERKFIDQKVKLLAKTWEDSEHKQLNEDLNKQISYLESINFQFAEMAEKYNLEEEEYIKEKDEALAEFKEKEDILAYETNCLRLEKLNTFLSEPENKKMLFLIKDFRVVKFQGLIQTMLYFIEYKKEDINIPGTNVLNWKKVKNFINDHDFLQKFLKYNHRGAKAQQVPAYSMLNRLLHRIEKYTQEECDKYNLTFGRLFKYFVLTLKMRKENIFIRRKQKERQKQERLEKIAEAEARAQRKIEALAEKKTSLKDEEEIAAFDEKEFEEQWDQENPEIEIPPEVQDEEDNDLEAEE